MDKLKIKLSESKRSVLKRMSKEQLEVVEAIVNELMNTINELKEATTTGAVAGYNTPNAFSSEEDKEKKKDRLVDDEYEFIDDMEEIMQSVELAENRWLDLKKDESRNNNRKIADQTSKIRKELADIRKRLNWCARIRNENEISKDEFHKRTEKNLNKIGPIIDDIRKISKEFKL